MEKFHDPVASARRFDDERGWLMVLHETPTMVLKRSFSRAGVFRGMHVQLAPHAQTKLIRVVSGAIRDFVFAIDDPAMTVHDCVVTPGDEWITIAPNLAHGFLALEDTLFEYVCDGPYVPAAEAAISIADHLTALGINAPILSAKDAAAPDRATWATNGRRAA